MLVAGRRGRLRIGLIGRDCRGDVDVELRLTDRTFRGSSPSVVSHPLNDPPREARIVIPAPENSHCLFCRIQSHTAAACLRFPSTLYLRNVPPAFIVGETDKLDHDVHKECPTDISEEAASMP